MALSRRSLTLSAVANGLANSGYLVLSDNGGILCGYGRSINDGTLK